MLDKVGGLLLLPNTELATTKQFKMFESFLKYLKGIERFKGFLKHIKQFEML